MNFQLKLRSKFFGTLLTVIFVSLQATADRSVSIVADNGKLSLVNGSPATVTYNVECYDKVNGSNLITNGTNLTLAPKAAADYLSSGTCASGVSSFTHSSGVIACTGTNVQFSAASALCTTTSPICTHNVLVAKGITSFTGFPNNFWFQASSDPFHLTYDNWGKTSPYPTTGGGKTYQPRTYTDSKGSNSYRCNPTNATGTPGSGIGYCGAGDNYQGISGALCCPTNNGFRSCKVTILSATPPTGHLQSPQFKGGSSF